MRIEVGYGLEGRAHGCDVPTASLTETITPAFRAGQLLRRHRCRPRPDDEADRRRAAAATGARAGRAAVTAGRRACSELLFAVLVGSVVLRGDLRPYARLALHRRRRRPPGVARRLCAGLRGPGRGRRISARPLLGVTGGSGWSSWSAAVGGFGGGFGGGLRRWVRRRRGRIRRRGWRLRRRRRLAGAGRAPMKLRRLVRHLFTTRWSTRRHFPRPVLRGDRAGDRASARRRHGGEIRFVVETALRPA